MLLNQGLENFHEFGNMMYFILTVPVLLIFAWHGSKSIATKDRPLFLKVIMVFLYISLLIGLLLLGNYIFLVLFFGFAP